MATVTNIVCLVVILTVCHAMPEKMHGTEKTGHHFEETAPENHPSNDLDVSSLFNSLDQDQDGFVSLAEHNKAALAATQGARDLGLSDAQKQHIMTKYDADKDGELSDDELGALFGKLDNDGDGQFSMEELSRSMHQQS